MDFTRRAPGGILSDPEHRAVTQSIVLRAGESDPEAGVLGLILEQTCLSPVLGNHEVHTPVGVKIAQGAASRLALDFDPALLAWNRHKLRAGQSFQPKPSTRVHSSFIRTNRKKILSQKKKYDEKIIDKKEK